MNPNETPKNDDQISSAPEIIAPPVPSNDTAKPEITTEPTPSTETIAPEQLPATPVAPITPDTIATKIPVSIVDSPVTSTLESSVTSNDPAPVVPSVTPSPKRARKFIITAVVFAVTAGLVFAGVSWYRKSTPTVTQNPTLKIGIMMAFSGGSSSMGNGARKGIDLAKKQLGANNIEIVRVDSKCDAKTAGEAVKSLIAQKVVAIIGEGCSSASIAALPAANNAKIPMISPSASSPALTIPNDYFFRVVPPDTMQGAFMAQTIYDKGLRNVAIFYTNEPYGSGMNSVFREKFESLGGKVVATASAEPDVIALTTQVKALKAANPQAIFIAPNSVVSATAIMKLTREAAITAPFFGADVMYDTSIIDNGPAVVEGLTISSFPTGTKSFKQALFNEYQKNEQLYAAPQAYDIIKILQVAAQKGATTGEQIKNLLPSIQIDGVSGFKQFDANGEVGDKDYKYDLFTVKSGAFILVE